MSIIFEKLALVSVIIDIKEGFETKLPTVFVITIVSVPKGHYENLVYIEPVYALVVNLIIIEQSIFQFIVAVRVKASDLVPP